MKANVKRVEEKTKKDLIIEKIQDYAYLETFVIVGAYLLIGYLINPQDVCILNGEISYILILLSILTLFHGFENGLLALGLIALAMWYFYEVFEYIEFLIALMMTLIFSEFHYFWTKKIREAELSSNYKGAKLDELSKSFYALKISHDQLEKNYVVKPMSIRNSIEQITNINMNVDGTKSLDEKHAEQYRNFLLLLEKSFNVSSGFIIYKPEIGNNLALSQENVHVSYSTASDTYEAEEIFTNYLVDKALTRMKPIFVSDEKGIPDSGKTSRLVAVIPSVSDSKVVSALVIEKMPFMAFNRENLTSISILLEYFTLEILEKNILEVRDDIKIIEDEKFRYEYIRLEHLYAKFNVSSIVLVLRINNELQATRIYEKILKMLRSLDMVTTVRNEEHYYLVLLFPLHDKSAAIGYVNRLINTLEEEKDKKFNYMTFDMEQNSLLNKYLSENYDE